MDAWRGFQGQAWRDQIDVRDFIVDNYTPYDGDSDFLSGPTVRTKQVWANLLDLMVVERERGILDVDAHTPSTITSHAPGHLEGEIIVGLQTDAPLKRAIMPNGGWRMVENSLKAYGYEPDPAVRDIFTKYRKTHNAGVFDAYTPAIRQARASHVAHRAAGRLRPRPDHRRLPARGAVRRGPADRRQARRSAPCWMRCTPPTTSSATARSWPSRSGPWAS